MRDTDTVTGGPDAHAAGRAWAGMELLRRAALGAASPGTPGYAAMMYAAAAAADARDAAARVLAAGG